VLSPFALHRPRTADEACALLTEFGDEAAPYAGGTELLLLMKMGLASARHLVDVKRVSGFDVVDIDARGGIRIGAAVTHRTIERSPALRARCAVLTDVARHVANVRVRNVGTVGGNLAFADPHSDLATVFLALAARVELVSPRGRRELALDEFVRGAWETVRAPDELLATITIPPLARAAVATYVKFGVHERPTLGIALTLVPDASADGTTWGDGARVASARLAVGCVNPRPTRVTTAEARLTGIAFADLADVSREVADLAAESVDAVDDLHGSADYKREMVAVFTRRALAAASARAMARAHVAHYPHAIVV
jgi:aerobic carbon-monoxide dehydrogenase medium subunit